MSKMVMKSRPVSFRVPVEDWGSLQGRAEAAGLSVGAFAARCVLEVVHPPLLEASSTEGQPYTGSFGIEASLPPSDRADAPDAPMLTESGEMPGWSAPDAGLRPDEAPNGPEMLTESEIRAESSESEDRRTRFERIMADMGETT